ncbi:MULTISPECIES: hypothetical protein [unclassified Francisella]|uniref:hypothetical protein n=1 Tax=unclassified Francisella TaxID=2610885 RepID=UPI002E376587|nr:MULTISPECIES: hypothetical protein [unclassified Francisella]MED7819637.1 hypothetical protein [Francisella sp. 19S2-4]MED7830457.1 hypothetical protein [Francisella sp. 19S2-10]
MLTNKVKDIFLEGKVLKLVLTATFFIFLISKLDAEEGVSYIITAGSGSILYSSCVSTVSLSGCEKASSMDDLESKVNSASSDLGLDGGTSEGSGSESGNGGGSDNSSTPSCSSLTTYETCSAQSGCIWFRGQCYISGV